MKSNLTEYLIYALLSILSCVLCVHMFILAEHGVPSPDPLMYSVAAATIIIGVALVINVPPLRKVFVRVCYFLIQVTTTKKAVRTEKLLVLFSSLPFLDERKDEQSEDREMNLYWDRRPLAIGVRGISYSLAILAIVGALYAFVGYKWDFISEGLVTRIVSGAFTSILCLVTFTRLSHLVTMLKGKMTSVYALGFCMVHSLREDVESKKFNDTVKAAFKMTSFCKVIVDTPRVIRVFQAIAEEKNDENVVSLLNLAAKIFNEPTLSIYEKEAFKRSTERLTKVYDEAFGCFRKYTILKKQENEPTV